MRALCLAILLIGCGDSAAITPDAVADADGDAMSDSTVCITTPRPPDSDPVVEHLLSQLETQMAAQGIPGLGFAVIDQGQTRTYALGKRQYGACEPFRSTTRIRLGRPARTLVSMAIQIAASEGKLALTDEVTMYLPGFQVANGDVHAVTIERLLDHSAGIYVDGFMKQCPSQDLAGYWSSASPSLEFAPAAAVASYDEELSLLGAVLGQVYGKPYRDVIAEKIFVPLGMTATYDHDTFLLGEHALGGIALEDPAPCAAWEPVHQVYVSLDDLVALARFVDGVNTTALPIDAALVRDANKPHHAKEFRTGYGMENMPYDQAGNRLYFTDGDGNNIGAEIDSFTSDGFTAAIVVNRGSCTYCIGDKIIGALSTHVFKNWMVPLPISRWSEYAGMYEDTVSVPSRTLTISLDAISTKLQATYNGITLPLSPYGEDSFEIDVFGVKDRFRFWRDGSGTPQIVTSQIGKLGPAFQRVP